MTGGDGVMETQLAVPVVSWLAKRLMEAQ